MIMVMQMKSLRNGFYRFMAGRYGNDNLNQFILLFATILIILNSIFISSIIVLIVQEILIVFYFYRSFSKKIYQRQQENFKYLTTKARAKKILKLFKYQIKDLKHRYYICPNCSQIVRVPSKKGKVEVVCGKCQSKFERRT